MFSIALLMFKKKQCLMTSVHRLLEKSLGKQVNRIRLSQNLLFKSVFGLCCGNSMYSES